MGWRHNYMADHYRAQVAMGRGLPGQGRGAHLPSKGVAAKLCKGCGAWTPIADMSDGRCAKCAPRIRPFFDSKANAWKAYVHIDGRAPVLHIGEPGQSQAQVAADASELAEREMMPE